MSFPFDDNQSDSIRKYVQREMEILKTMLGELEATVSKFAQMCETIESELDLLDL
ncbi:hypothetical protein NHH03_16275 [Stieleria sp. TO1_6]|uniref:hypothetical protein n=1 Tax=Stieleria tagensis TaxID=2956795 RepID=UPI00209AC0A2|nr:hypothetical protein [Stieleria tagensis]MCO8123307.1 hypothetical protein [Stieleria tagensis]